MLQCYFQIQANIVGQFRFCIGLFLDYVYNRAYYTTQSPSFFLQTICFPSLCLTRSPWRPHGGPAASKSESESPRQLKRKRLFIAEWENGEPLYETFLF